MKLPLPSLPLAALLIASSIGHALAAPKLAIVIDDLGYGTWPVNRAINLPAEVTLSVFPSLPSSRDVAEKAHQAGHEILVHLPMQPLGADNKLNPGTLRSDMSDDQFLQQMMLHLQSVPYAVGASNHMGSRLTAERQAMLLTMTSLKSWGNLFFLDSRTTKHTIAQAVANETNVANTRRDVFLDNDQNPAAIRRALEKAFNKAKQNGHAIAVGHPHKATLTVLENDLQRMAAAAGVELVPVSAIISGNIAAATAKATAPAAAASEQTARPTPKPSVQVNANVRTAVAPTAGSQAKQPTPAANTGGNVVYANRAESVIYADSEANRAFLETLPLAESFPGDQPAPGE